MRHKVSITIGEDTLAQIRIKMVQTKRFRNKSHFFEVAAMELLQREVEG